eukprot:g1642.t1
MKRDSQANVRTRNFMRATLRLEHEWLRDEMAEAKEEQRALERAREDSALSVERFFHDQIKMIQETVDEQRASHAAAQTEYRKRTKRSLRDIKAERAEWLGAMMDWLENWDHGEFEGDPDMAEVAQVLRSVCKARRVGPGVGRSRRKAVRQAALSGSPRPAWS